MNFVRQTCYNMYHNYSIDVPGIFGLWLRLWHINEEIEGAVQEQEAMVLRIVSHSSAQTQQLGAHLGKLLRGGELLLLEGQLGMGKTTFTQGLARGMGIKGVINSPTFTLLKEYAGHPSLYHFDLYRLEDPEEMFALGFEDYFSDSSGVCVVEWADRAEGLWPIERLTVFLYAMNETERTMMLTACGTRYLALLQEFQKSAYAITGA